MLGSVAVGKTSLVRRFVDSMFSEKYLTTVGVKIDQKALTVDGAQALLMLWDIEGVDDTHPFQPAYLRGASGCFLVADGTRGSTLDDCIYIQEQVQALVGDVPFSLLLNKADLESRWTVDRGRIEELQGSGWDVRWTSALTGDGVEAAFDDLTRRMLAP